MSDDGCAVKPKLGRKLADRMTTMVLSDELLHLLVAEADLSLQLSSLAWSLWNGRNGNRLFPKVQHLW